MDKNVKSAIYGFLQNLLISTVIFTFVASAFAIEKSATQWKSIDSHDGSIMQISYDPKNKTFATVSKNDKVTVYDKNFNVTKIYSENNIYNSNTKFIPGNKLLAVSNNKENYSYISLVDITEKNVIDKSRRILGHISKLSVSPSGKYIAAGNSDGLIYIYNLIGNQIKFITYLKVHNGKINDISFSFNDKLIATSGDDKKVKILEIDKNNINPIYSLIHKDIVNSVSFSKNNKFIFSADKGKNINVWNLKNKPEEIQSIKEHTSDICILSESSDGQFLASAGDDKSVILWRISDKGLKKIQTLVGHVESINSLVFSPDNNYLLSGSNDKTMKVWKL